jgi:predicted GNAT superfamily acetyltransferase
MTDSAALATMNHVTDQERAHAAAAAAGVTVRDVTELAELEAVYRLYDGIWRPDPDNPPVTTKLLRALAKAGNHVSGAFDGPVLVGACVGFFGPPAARVLHSHVAGVSAAAVGRGVGYALKLHQRAWAVERGIAAVEWTFDPLVGRNAHFNIAKLGALPVEYLPNFYGGMDDDINGGDDSDRLLVRWDLAADPGPAGSGALDAVVALGRSEEGAPVLGSTAGGALRVAVPHDVEKLRRTDPGLAKEWRGAVREVLVAALADGKRITGYDRAGWYVLTSGRGSR